MVLYLQSGADNIYLNGNIPVIDGLWHHIAATRNGTTGETKLYVDGVLGGSKTKLFSSDFSSPSAKLEIGSYLNTYRFDGNLDEIAIFNNELNLTEISTHYNKGLSGNPLAKKHLFAANPVFEDFNSIIVDNRINLNWNTKIDAAGVFEIERSSNESEEWNSFASLNSNGSKNFTYEDASASQIGKYSYKIKFTGNDGGYAYSNISEIELLPLAYKLDQNYPNPFNPSTTIVYELPNSSRVNMIIYNMLGEKVTELVNEVQSAGKYKEVWNAGRFASGVYILRLEASSTSNDENFSKILKLMLVK